MSDLGGPMAKHSVVVAVGAAASRVAERRWHAYASSSS
eukprot:gene22244-16677_t